ncbi:rod shape-determining protein, subunit D [Gottschalkia purinilytica]|uniref:Rod shape-determining protein, subunit D n=1 Tax=Gottschalkia purinilytica TaxID=1503 RepID=A0A0L0WDB7_GOTPU|nr:rod shape-determining protein MreD [Gottschalkia purinilytica]KNF09459.1 rod shape-determining protein, subunit D [Gottschalkia purinilytica]
MNYIIIAGIIILNFILQSTVFQYFHFLQVLPNTSLILVVTYSLLAGKNSGAIVGLAVGLLQDIFFYDVIGVNALIYFLIGYVLGLLDEKVFKENLILPFLITAATTAVFHIMHYFFMYFLSVDVHLIPILKNVLLKEAIYNAVLSIFVYKYMLKFYKEPRIKFTKRL